MCIHRSVLLTHFMIVLFKVCEGISTHCKLKALYRLYRKWKHCIYYPLVHNKWSCVKTSTCTQETQICNYANHYWELILLNWKEKNTYIYTLCFPRQFCILDVIQELFVESLITIYYFWVATIPLWEALFFFLSDSFWISWWTSKKK